MIYIDNSNLIPDDLIIEGNFFNSKLDNQHFFVLEFIMLKKGSNVKCNIYTTTYPQIEIEDNELVRIPKHSVEKMVSIDIWNKYYFPTWNNEDNQYYHNKDGTEDEIGARAEIMKIALKMGLE